MVWASTKDLPNNRNYVVKNRQIKNGALAKLSPTLIIRNFEINWGILKDLLTFWPCLRVCLLAVIQNVRGRGEGGGEWNDWAGKLEQITPGPRSSLGLGQPGDCLTECLSSGFCKIAQIARREAGPDQTGAVLGWVRSGVGGSADQAHICRDHKWQVQSAVTRDGWARDSVCFGGDRLLPGPGWLFQSVRS